MSNTFIPGKDAALEISIERMQKQLKQLGFNIEEASWLNPVANVWSVHIRDKDCSLCFTNGKGASKKAALASALGEYFERLACNYFFADFYLGEQNSKAKFVHYPNEKWFPITDSEQIPLKIMDSRMLSAYDPNGELRVEHLVDCNSSNKDRGICTLPYKRQSDQRDVYVPVSIIGNLYVSNGMSAGNTATEARVQALSEIFERSIKNRIIAEAISLPEIPQAVMNRYPGIVDSINAMEAEGFKLYCMDASLGGEYPVISVVLLNPDNGTAYASFGAHPRFEVALERTVTELLQGRSLKDLDVFSEPTFANDDVAEHFNLETHFIDSSGLLSWDLFRSTPDYEFSDWDYSGSTEQEFTQLMSIFNRLDFEVYISDFEHLGVYACRIIVPGMSEIYPAEELVWSNNNSGNKIREQILSLPFNKDNSSFIQKLLKVLDEEQIDDGVPVAEYIGIAAAADDVWGDLRFGELRSLMLLALSRSDEALELILWTLDYSQSSLPKARVKFYKALSNLLQIKLNDEKEIPQYQSVFEKIYGKEIVAEALKHISGEKKFINLEGSDLTLSRFELHQKLLQAYAKLQTVK